MEEKNMALLGFISSAADYLKDQLGEENEDIKEINDINFNKLKSEFTKKIDSSFDNVNVSDDMIKAGKDVFDEFISKKSSLIEEFDDIFNIDFKKQEENETSIKNHLLDMLEESNDEDSDIEKYTRIIANNAGENQKVEAKVKEPQKGMDDVFSEIVANEKANNKSSDYISDLLNDLNHSKIAKAVEENKKREEATRRAVLDSIKKMYPYLSNSFVKGVYALKDSFKEEFDQYEKIVILHRLKFEELDGLRKFVEVVSQYAYLVNVDEKQMIVDTFKEHENVEGKILTDIFMIANQGKLLTGEYEGYRVLINKQED